MNATDTVKLADDLASSRTWLPDKEIAAVAIYPDGSVRIIYADGDIR